MKFLANENFPIASVRQLRHIGYDVAAIIEDSPSAEDVEVLARANREKRIILTFDRDYGELIYKLKLPVPAGVIYFRFMPSMPIEPANYVVKLLSFENIFFEGNFTVVERNQIRQRPLIRQI